MNKPIYFLIFSALCLAMLLIPSSCSPLEALWPRQRFITIPWKYAIEDDFDNSTDKNT